MTEKDRNAFMLLWTAASLAGLLGTALYLAADRWLAFWVAM
jgi:hypothetical protein